MRKPLVVLAALFLLFSGCTQPYASPNATVGPSATPSVAPAGQVMTPTPETTGQYPVAKPSGPVGKSFNGTLFLNDEVRLSSGFTVRVRDFGVISSNVPPSVLFEVISPSGEVKDQVAFAYNVTETGGFGKEVFPRNYRNNSVSIQVAHIFAGLGENPYVNATVVADNTLQPT